MQPYLTMALNNAWANATFYAALAPLPSGAFTAPRPGFFPTLSGTMNHIHQVDLYYLDALEEAGLGRAVFDRPTIEDPSRLAALQAQADMRFAAFCRALTAPDLARRVATDRPDAPGQSERIDALILHLLQHQVHHRGQAHVQLQHAGITPPQLDDFHLDYGRVPSAAAYFA